MSDTAHLLIPFASSRGPGCAETLARLRLPTLEKLLARLQPGPVTEGDERMLSMPHERVIARESGLQVVDDATPWAALQLVRAGRDPQGGAWAWIIPCHWAVGQNQITMTHPDHLRLEPSHSQALLTAMRPYFEEDGIELEFESPTLWLARGEVFRGFASASLDRVIGQLVQPWLPEGEATRPIRRLQQEMQMLLYTHEVNEARARGGLPPVNSFWVSGSGALPEGFVARKTPGLRIAENLREPALLQDWNAWADAWRQLDGQACATLLQALEDREQIAITLCGERTARTFSGTGGGFLGKLAATLRPSRAAEVLATL